MQFNDPNECKARGKRSSILILEEEKNKCVRRMTFAGTSTGLSLGYALLSKGKKAEKAVALAVAVASVPSGFDHLNEYKAIKHELAEQGVEVGPRTRDMVASAGLSVAASLAALGTKSVAKSVAKSTGFF